MTIESKANNWRPTATLPALQARAEFYRTIREFLAARFEIYMQGIELANGYYELQDAAEQEKRFAADNALRSEQKIHQMQPDERLVAALAVGFPECAGIALGLDRLLMFKLQAKSIAEVLTFTIENA